MEPQIKRVPFFENARRQITLKDWSPKRNREDEKRLRLDIQIPLDGQPLAGIPGFISDPWATMGKEDSAVKALDFEQQIEGVTIEFYATDSAKEREYLLTGCTLRDFSLIRVRDGDDNTITLSFNTTVPRSKKLLNWADEYDGKTLYAKFSEGQMSIPAPDPQMSLGENHNDIQGEERRGAVNGMTAKEKAALSKVDKGARSSAKRASEARA